jgi:hypothetical protein
LRHVLQLVRQAYGAGQVAVQIQRGELPLQFRALLVPIATSFSAVVTERFLRYASCFDSCAAGLPRFAAFSATVARAVSVLGNGLVLLALVRVVVVVENRDRFVAMPLLPRAGA